MSNPTLFVELSTLDDIIKTAVTEALRYHNHNLTAAAKHLRISRRSIYDRIERYGLIREPFRSAVPRLISDETAQALACFYDHPLAERPTIHALAGEYQVSRSTIASAIHWGRKLLAEQVPAVSEHEEREAQS